MIRIIRLRNSRIFNKIYQKNGFQGKDSISGPGSDLEQTNAIRAEIPKLLKEFNLRIFLDIPCGDFYWMKMIDLRGHKYIGGDIIEELIEFDNKEFGNEDRNFLRLDLLTDKLPPADVLLCRDCLVHFSYKDIFRALKNIESSPITYLLTTSFSDRERNVDIRTGQWRPLNLLLSPFNFPDPIKVISEKCTENDGKYFDKSLMLWKVKDLPHLEL